jgi:hypothetical protein
MDEDEKKLQGYCVGNVESKCPACGKVCTFDLHSIDVSPFMDGDTAKFFVQCDDCGKDWEVGVKISL